MKNELDEVNRALSQFYNIAFLYLPQSTGGLGTRKLYDDIKSTKLSTTIKL